jgi:ADP-ribosyl-[dinitrogen reductase] hydrolase
MTKQESRIERSLGCLLAGAAGDALGSPVEFLSHDEILRRFGPQGIRDYVEAYGGIGKITDDTQMTLFTAEGLLRAFAASMAGCKCDNTEIMRRAYVRWLATQGIKGEREVDQTGWLIKHQQLFSRRAPGNTCLTALQRIGGENNHSKGCGGIMRVAPCGILHAGNPEQAYLSAVMAAKLTHGHPTGYLTAGVLAAIIAEVVIGKTLLDATHVARHILTGDSNHNETVNALDSALQMAAAGQPPEVAISALGEGWVAEEALAVSLYCALSARSVEDGIVNAVNITGDSDSTGAITGNLLGAVYGAGAIPVRWLHALELREVIETIACDLALVSHRSEAIVDPDLVLRYPAD